MGPSFDADDEVESLAPAAPADDPQVVELGHVVLHDGRVVEELAAEVLVVADPQTAHSAVLDITEGDHFKGHRQGLVAPPVSGQLGAEDIGRPRLDQLARVLGQDLRHLPLSPPPLRRVHAAPLLISCKDNGCSHTDIIDNSASNFNPPE